MTEFTTWRSLVDGAEISAIPDISVERDADDGTTTDDGKNGVAFETTVEWPSFDGRISQNTGGVTRAYLINKDSSDIIADIDISNLSAGDAFRFEDVDLDPEPEYTMELDAEGETYDQGFASDGGGLPVSSDGDELTMTGGAGGGGGDRNDPSCISEIGNLLD